MKGIMQRTINAVMFGLVLLATQTVFAYYNPSTGRFSSRDPIGEPGFRVLQRAQGTFQTGPVALAQQSSRWINRDLGMPNNMERFSGANVYGFVGNDSVNTVDPLGLCDIKIRCVPVVRGITLGWHCGVIAPNGVEYGLGGGNQSSGSSGTATPYPTDPNQQPGPASPPPTGRDYAVSCPCKSCDEVQRSIQNYHDNVIPPPYNATGPNSDTYAHNMLNASGCKVNPIPQPCYYMFISPGQYALICPGPTTTPPGTVAW